MSLCIGCSRKRKNIPNTDGEYFVISSFAIFYIVSYLSFYINN